MVSVVVGPRSGWQVAASVVGKDLAGDEYRLKVQEPSLR